MQPRLRDQLTMINELDISQSVIQELSRSLAISLSNQIERRIDELASHLVSLLGKGGVGGKLQSMVAIKSFITSGGLRLIPLPKFNLVRKDKYFKAMAKALKNDDILKFTSFDSFTELFTMFIPTEIYPDTLGQLKKSLSARLTKYAKPPTVASLLDDEQVKGDITTHSVGVALLSLMIDSHEDDPVICFAKHVVGITNENDLNDRSTLFLLIDPSGSIDPDDDDADVKIVMHATEQLFYKLLSKVSI